MFSESRAVALRSLGPLLAFGLVVLLVAVSLSQLPTVQRWSGDVRIFEHYAALTFSGELGRTPFLSWYPPAALVPVGLPLLAGGGPAYVLAIITEMTLLAVVGLAIVRSHASARGEAAAPWLFGILCVACVPLFAWRYDLVPAVLTLGGVVLLVACRWGWAGVAFGLAAGLKLYAAPLGAIAVAWAWRHGGGAGARSAAIGFVATGLACAAAYLLFPPASPVDLLAFTAARPLHVESVPGSVIGLAAALGGPAAELRYTSGSFNLVSPLAEPALAAARMLQPVIVGGTLLAAVAAIVRDRLPAPRLLVSAALAVLLALIVSNKVLSAQYVVWILPLVPLTRGWLRGTLVAGILGTAIVFPWLYEGVVMLEGGPMTLVVIRNALLLAAWVMATVALIRSVRGVSRVPAVRQAGLA